MMFLNVSPSGAVQHVLTPNPSTLDVPTCFLPRPYVTGWDTLPRQSATGSAGHSPTVPSASVSAGIGWALSIVLNVGRCPWC